MPTTKKRVLLVDDHQMVRRGFRLMLEPNQELELVGEAADVDAAMAAVQTKRPDLIVMDIHLPGTGGLEISRRVLADFPATKIVILSADAETETINAALRIGVAGYILKESTPDELPRAIDAVLKGKLYLSPEVADLVLQDYKRTLAGATSVRPLLSEQERGVLRLLAQGLRTKEIAAEMKISVKTVETYRRRISQKLDCQSIAELTRYAIREGIVSL